MESRLVDLQPRQELEVLLQRVVLDLVLVALEEIPRTREGQVQTAGRMVEEAQWLEASRSREAEQAEHQVQRTLAGETLVVAVGRMERMDCFEVRQEDNLDLVDNRFWSCTDIVPS